MYLQVITAVSTAALTFLTVRWAGARDKRGVSGGGGESTAAATAAVASGTSGAEHLVPPRRLTQRPRVLVMGFFDMLHHGHIAFLKCAAKFGDVVVVVGRDANHFARKNRYPIMGEQIRLVAVRELRVVTDAVLAKGLGLLDFEDNLAALRPIDAIFATQDNDRAEVEALCNERGIEYIVRPKPSLTAIFGVDLPEMHPKHIRASFEMAFRDSPGGGGAPSAMGMGIGMGGGGAGSANGAGGGAPLRLRTVSSSEHLLRLSSTSLSSQRSPHSPFSSPLRAPTTAPGATPPPSPGSTAAGAGGAGAAVSADDFPWRLCIGGGWLDQPWVSEKHAGACIVVNVLPNVNFRSHCGLATSTRKIGMLLWGGTAAGDGAAGRGRSARRGAGVGRAGGAPPPNTSCEERARLLFGACNPPYSDYVLGAGGSLGLMLPGINRLNFDGEYWPRTIVPCASEESIAWLERVLFLVPLFEQTSAAGGEAATGMGAKHPEHALSAQQRKVGQRALAFSTHWDRNITPGTVGALAKASRATWDAITAMDVAALGAAFTATSDALSTMLPDSVPQARWTEPFGAAPHCGHLLSGGGGGFLYVIASELSEQLEQRGAFQIEVRRTAWEGKRGSGAPSHRPSSAPGEGDAGPPPLVLASAADSSRFEERRRLVKIEMGGLSMLDEYAAVERAGRSPRLASSELLRGRTSPRDWIERESEAY